MEEMNDPQWGVGVGGKGTSRDKLRTEDRLRSSKKRANGEIGRILSASVDDRRQSCATTAGLAIN